MSLYSLGASALGGAAIAAFITFKIVSGLDAADLGKCHTDLATARGSVSTLTTGINARNDQINKDHIALLVAQKHADDLQAAANARAGQAGAKADAILKFVPGDDYSLSTFDVIQESLK